MRPWSPTERVARPSNEPSKRETSVELRLAVLTTKTSVDVMAASPPSTKGEILLMYALSSAEGLQLSHSMYLAVIFVYNRLGMPLSEGIYEEG